MTRFTPAPQGPSELDRLLASAKAAQALAAEMVATKTEIPGGMEAVARGVADAGKAAELAVKQQKGRELARSVMSLTTSDVVTDEYGNPRGGLFDETARKGLLTAVKSRSTFRTEINAKAALTSGTLLPTTGTGVEPGLFPNAFPLATLFRTEEAGSPSIRYYVLDAATAGVVAEGALKPDSGVTITPKDVLLKKVATTVRFSDELSDDSSFLIPFLQSELVSAVITKENAEILAQFNATTGVLTGTGLATAAIDVIADAIAGQEALNGSAPTAVVVHPNVMATLRKVKSSTEEHLLDPLTAGPPTLHGVKVVSTPATAAGTAWVIGGQGVVIYRRGQITAEIGMNADDWTTNQRTMRVEERFATAVVRPSMLTKVTLT